MNNQPSEIWEDAETRINSAYTILQELPSSPQSRIAIASRYGRRLLLKCLPADHADDMRYRETLIKEFEILVSLNHEHIVKAISMDNIPSLGLCIAMEYIEGVPLNEFVDGNTPRRIKLHLLQDILSALAYIHSKQIVHRDLKPSNIMVADGACVKIIDFGLSDSNTYEILKQPAGTIGYASPEQQAGLPADPRNDIYSIGVIMRELKLGWMYAPIIKRCVGDLEKRPSAEELQKALRRVGHVCHSLVAAFAVIAVLAVASAFYITRQATPPAQESIVKVDTVYKNVMPTDTTKPTVQPVTLRPTKETKGYNEIIAEAKRMIDKDVESEEQFYDTLTNYYYDMQKHNDFVIQELRKLNDFSRDRCRGYDYTTSIEITSEISAYFSAYVQKWHTKVQKLGEERVGN